MKTIKKILLLTLLAIISNGYIYCQIMEWDKNYTYTVFYDDFSNILIDLNKWHIEDDDYLHHTLFIDSSATVSVDAGKLKLTTISCPNCSSGGITRNHAAGKITTKDKFKYGIFESRIYFPRKEGTSAYFALRGGNGVSCEQGGLYENEIFIANSWWRHIYPCYHLSHRINHYHTGTDCVDDYEFVNDKSYENSSSSTYRIYKCIWTPSYVRYYRDGTLIHEVLDTGSKCPECNKEWFPKFSMYLSFYQIINHDVPLYIDVPQTTYIDFVSVKKFFATPEIILSSDVICTNGSATINTDSDASNILWSLSPSGLFTGATSGSGKIASINAGSAKGEGKITYSFEMPGGETFEAEETFWVGKPSLDVSSEFFKIISADGGSDYVCTDQAGNEFDLSYFNNKCGCTNYEIKLTSLNGITVYDQFYTSGNGDLDYPYLSEGWYIIWARGYNACGWGDWVSTELEFRDCSQMLLLFTPNPTTGETIMSIESTSKEKTFDENTPWDFEVYSETQLLKTKQTNLRGQSTKIQTNGWKEGVYSVRVKYQNEILTGKLVVKR
jgi:beta-glucanase (GH16 family)